MQDLLSAMVAPDAAVPALYEAELDAARSFAEQEKAEATRAAYRADWRLFGAWCQERGLEALPASPEAVAGFFPWLGRPKLAPRRLRSRAGSPVSVTRTD